MDADRVSLEGIEAFQPRRVACFGGAHVVEAQVGNRHFGWPSQRDDRTSSDLFDMFDVAYLDLCAADEPIILTVSFSLDRECTWQGTIFGRGSRRVTVEQLAAMEEENKQRLQDFMRRDKER